MSEETRQEDSERLQVAGTYAVAIVETPQWFAMQPKDGDTARMELRIRGYVNGGPQDGKWIDGRLNFIRTIIEHGKHAGKTCFEVAEETCRELGMSEPFSPSKVSELKGATCEFVCEFEEYQGRTRLKVKYINTNSRPPLAPDEADAIWAELQKGAAVNQSMPPAAMAGTPIEHGGGLLGDGGDPDDNVPFDV